MTPMRCGPSHSPRNDLRTARPGAAGTSPRSAWTARSCRRARPRGYNDPTPACLGRHGLERPPMDPKLDPRTHEKTSVRSPHRRTRVMILRAAVGRRPRCAARCPARHKETRSPSDCHDSEHRRAPRATCIGRLGGLHRAGERGPRHASGPFQRLQSMRRRSTAVFGIMRHGLVRCRQPPRRTTSPTRLLGAAPRCTRR